MKKSLLLVAVLSTLSINSALALPIDWSGVFGADMHYINNFRKTDDTIVKPAGTVADPKKGSQGIDSRGGNTANFQTYIFRLQPQVIVNDGVTFKSELSTGQIRGGFMGDNSANNADGSGNNSYYFTTPANQSGLNVNQAYMELYADTALVKIGRMSKHYGLGVVFDDGKEAWDRFFTMYDGVEATMRIGNFSVTPYWAKISSTGDAATGTTNANNGVSNNKSADVREMGVTAQYDNKNRDLVLSVLYAKRFSESGNKFYNADDANDPDANGSNTFKRGKTNVTIIDAYASKKWNKFKLAAEIPLINGDYGNVYDASTKSKIAATAYIVEASYELNPKWTLNLHAGQINGDKGSSNKFEAMYLHPNYQIADLMFRYYYPSINEGGRSVFDSSITNTQYVKLATSYSTDKWTWKFAGIMANAMETAKEGSRGYHHEENYAFASNEKQDKSLGLEFDLGFDYRWNPNVTISGYYGYWMVGDYYSFNNDAATKIKTSDVHGGGLRATLEF